MLELKQIPLLIHRFSHPTWLTNTYLLENTETNTSLAIDAGISPSNFESVLARTRFIGTFITHAHHDHTECTREWLSYGPLFGTKESFASKNGIPLTGGEIFPFEGFTVTAIATPGHLSSHLAYHIAPDLLFTGDLLFRGSVGGTSGGSFQTLKNSVESLYTLFPMTTRIFPGHSEESTLAYELETNPFIKTWRGILPSLNLPCTAKGRKAELIQRGTDYDGEEKYWVCIEGIDAILPQDQVALGNISHS